MECFLEEQKEFVFNVIFFQDEEAQSTEHMYYVRLSSCFPACYSSDSRSEKTKKYKVKTYNFSFTYFSFIINLLSVAIICLKKEKADL